VRFLQRLLERLVFLTALHADWQVVFDGLQSFEDRPACPFLLGEFGHLR
jgi:hypothetical protein